MCLSEFASPSLRFPGKQFGLAPYPRRTSEWLQESITTTSYLLEKAGLPLTHFYDLRRTYASLLINQGGDVKFIQAQLGRGSPRLPSTDMDTCFLILTMELLTVLKRSSLGRTKEVLLRYCKETVCYRP